MMRVYLDNCVFNRPYDVPSNVRISNEAAAKMHIQQLIETRNLEMVVSYALVFENSRCPNPAAKEYNLGFMRRNCVQYIGPDKIDSLKPLVEEIMSKGIKMPDATHIVCAIEGKCDYLITADDKMLKYKDPRIKIISPTEMLYLMEV